MFQKNTFLTISQTAKKTDIPSHVLRFWEKKIIFLKPKKGERGRRYYSSNDIEVLLLIKKLLYEEGFTIKGAINFMNLNYNNENKLKKIYKKKAHQYFDGLLDKKLTSNRYIL